LNEKKEELNKEKNRKRQEIFPLPVWLRFQIISLFFWDTKLNSTQGKYDMKKVNS